MKIAIVSHDLSGGGMERVAAILATGLAKKRHSVNVFIERKKLANIAYVDPSVSLTVLEGNSRIARICSLVRYLRAGQYDVVHTINPLLTLQVLMVRRCIGSKRVAIIGSYHGFANRGIPKRHRILSYISYLLTPIITRVTDKNICVSNMLKADLIQQMGAKPNNLLTIYNPVAAPQTRDECVQRTEDLPSNYILYVGRLTEDKNPALALRAFALLPERFSQFSLIVLGAGPLLKELHRLAEKLNIRDRVYFMGYVSEPWKFYRNAKALVSTSYTEAFGLAVVEALAYGVPVVSTKSGGPQEVLDEGRFGSLVPVEDEIAFSNAVADAIDEPPARDMLRARAAEYGVDRAVDAYEQLFSQIVIERQFKDKTLLASHYLTIPSDRGVSAQAEEKLYWSIKTSRGTRMTTEPHRLDQINELFFTTLNRLKLVPRCVMDIGISSGVTTLEWMREFDKRNLPVTMIATDLIMKVYLFQVSKNICAMTEINGHLLQIEIFGKPVYAYRLRRDYLTGGIVWRTALCAYVKSRLSESLRQGPYHFVTPALRGHNHIVLREDDIYGPKREEFLGCADVIRVGNLIQPIYFTDDEIRHAVQAVRERCRGADSLVIVCRNKPDRLEGSILRLTDRKEFVVEARLGPGSEVEQFFTSRL